MDILSDLNQAQVGDGMQVGPRRFPITLIGRSSAVGGFATREFTLGRDDFYLVVEGDLSAGDPSRIRAVLTYEIAGNEATCPDGDGRTLLLSRVLQAGDDAPRTASYHGRVYKFARRVDADYRNPDRSARRVTWDYEFSRRNLAVERWPGGEMAVYEGEVVPLDSIRVLRDYQPPATPQALVSRRPGAAIRSPVGLLAGVILSVIGLVLLFS